MSDPKNRPSPPNVDQWTAMFDAIGLDEPTMREWHRVFEQRHPEGHEAFLVWIGLEPDKVRNVRLHAQA